MIVILEFEKGRRIQVHVDSLGWLTVRVDTVGTGIRFKVGEAPAVMSAMRTVMMTARPMEQRELELETENNRPFHVKQTR